MGVREVFGSGRSVVVYLYAAENSGTLSRSAMQERNWNMGGCNCPKMNIECASEGQCDCTQNSQMRLSSPSETGKSSAVTSNIVMTE